MPDETTVDQTDEVADLKAAEFEALKERATKLGIKFHPSIGEDKLREKVREVLAQEEEAAANAEEEEEESNEEDTSAEKAKAPKAESQSEFRARKKKEAAALVRVQVTCMNPYKRQWEGEIIEASNSVVGTFKKHIQFNTPYHVPQILLNQLRQRKCQIFVTQVNPSTKRKETKGKMISEFAIEVLPPLTQKELKELAQRQAMANGTAGA